MYNPAQAYSVAASRMGYSSRPMWCFTNKAVNTSIFDQDHMTSDLNPGNILVLVTFNRPTKIYTYINTIQHFACESL
jgi:hypothetical protein